MIFGRHPAVIIGFIQAGLMLASQLWWGWSEAQVMGLVGILVIVGDVVVAGFTRDTVLGALVGLFKAGAAAALLFGFEMDAQTQAAWITFLTAGIGMLQMLGTSPIPKFSLKLQSDHTLAA